MKIRLLHCILLLAALLPFHQPTFAAAPMWSQATVMDGAGDDWGQGIAALSDGSVAVTGWFEDTVRFGSNLLLSAGMHDIFVARFARDGKCLWAFRIGGHYDDWGYELAVDNKDNIYVAGSFEGKAAFGDTELISAGNLDVYLVRVSPAGKVIWAAQGGGPLDDFGIGVAVNDTGDICVVGSFSGKAAFGTQRMSCKGRRDAFIAEYDTNGVFEWANQMASVQQACALAVAVDDVNNSFYITGYSDRTGEFGMNSVLATKKAESDDKDIFITSVTFLGSPRWIRYAGGSGDDAGIGVAFDPKGTVYVVGRFSQKAIFPSLSSFRCRDVVFICGDTMSANGRTTFSCDKKQYQCADTTLVSRGGTDIFAAAWDTAGGFAWARGYGGPHDDEARGACIDKAGDIVFTGFFSDTAWFGRSMPASRRNWNIFCASVNQSGSLLWTASAGSDGTDEGTSVACSGRDFVIAGGIGGEADIGRLHVTTTRNEGVLIARLSYPGK
jgi:hypothetical protein